MKKVKNYRNKWHSANSWKRWNGGMMHSTPFYTFRSIPPLSAFAPFPGPVFKQTEVGKPCNTLCIKVVDNFVTHLQFHRGCLNPQTSAQSVIILFFFGVLPGLRTCRMNNTTLTFVRMKIYTCCIYRMLITLTLTSRVQDQARPEHVNSTSLIS